MTPYPASSRNPVSQKVLVSLALLKTFSDHGRSYVDLFVPLVVDCLSAATHPEISAPALCSAVQESFGIAIPVAAMKAILRRAEKHNYLKRVDGIYTRNDAALSAPTLRMQRANVERAVRALASSLEEYARQRHQVEWTRDEAADALLGFISRHAIDVLTMIAGQPIIAASVTSTPKSTYVVATFIAYVCQEDPATYELLKTTVKGRMLADVLVFSNLDSVAQKFDNLTCFLDTPIILGAVGLNGPEFEAANRQTLDILYQQNVVFRIFEHTREEIHGVLSAAEHALLRGERFRGPALPFFAREHVGPSDIQLMRVTLDRRLEALHVRIVPKPPFDANSDLDESRLATVLSEMIHFKSEEQLRHDLESLTAVYRLRRDDRPIRLELSKAIFLTTNLALAHASAQYFDRNHGYSPANVPVCFTFDALGTLAWVKNPTRFSDLPALRLTADCYAALNPDERLWDRILAEAVRLRSTGDLTDQDFALLRDSTEARIAIMDVTKGEPDVFVIGTIREVLNVAKRNIRAEVEARLDFERSKRSTSERELAELQAKYAARESDRNLQDLRQREVIWERSRHIARPAAYITGIVLWLVVAIGTAWGYYREPTYNISFKTVLDFSGVVALVWTALNVFMGTSVITLIRRFELWLADCIQRKLQQVVGIHSTGDIDKQ